MHHICTRVQIAANCQLRSSLLSSTQSLSLPLILTHSHTPQTFPSDPPLPIGHIPAPVSFVPRADRAAGYPPGQPAAVPPALSLSMGRGRGQQAGHVLARHRERQPVYRTCVYARQPTQHRTFHPGRHGVICTSHHSYLCTYLHTPVSVLRLLARTVASSPAPPETPALHRNMREQFRSTAILHS